MLSRKELIDILANLAAPLTPFTLEGAPEDGTLFIDWLERRSQEQFNRIQGDAVNAFIDIVLHPPELHEYVPPARDEESFRTEFLGLAESYSNSLHAPRIIKGIEPALQLPSQRRWAVDVLGRLKTYEALPLLHAFAASNLTKEEEMHIIEALGERAEPEARALLEELHRRCLEPEAQARINTLLRRFKSVEQE
ncbi:HEAT repeat domain-containing protein [Hyalangium minutum]|uniref:HEAT repeat domain-containing protein n=1 Tax=Hyalangium minutum TaxID=394096 RepID=UPI00094AEB98|nr:HEAT repeat domain-containing protein [Hyalangium minutum]